MTCIWSTGCRLCSLCGAMLWATLHSGQGAAGRCCCSSGGRWCHHCQRGPHPAPAEEEQHASPYCSLMGTGELCTHGLLVVIQAAACVKSDSQHWLCSGHGVIAGQTTGHSLWASSRKQDTRTDANALVTTCLRFFDLLDILIDSHWHHV